MKFVFASMDQLFYKAFCGILCSEEDESFFYENIVDFVSDFLAEKILPDFVLVDGHCFSEFKNFLFCILRGCGRQIPAIFLDRNISKPLRTAKWLSEIELCFNSPDYHYLVPSLEKINRILSLPACQNCGQDTADSEEVGGHGRKLLLKPKIMLTPVNNLLYDFFFKNRRRIVFIEEIAEILKIQSEKETGRDRKNGVYAYVSRFRKSISEIECSYELLRICRGGYQLVLKN